MTNFIDFLYINRNFYFLGVLKVVVPLSPRENSQNELKPFKS